MPWLSGWKGKPSATPACKHPMVKQKSKPVKRAEAHTLIYKQAKFIDIPAHIGASILSMMDTWNSKAFVPERPWDMEIRATFSPDCFGLFVKHGVLPAGRVFAFMKGDIVIMPLDCQKRPPATHYDVQSVSHCVYTDDTGVHEFACYIMGTGVREPFNGQLCNHTCVNPNCELVNLVVALPALSLPLIGVRSLVDIPEGGECLTNYGGMLSDVPLDGFVPCLCAACDGAGKFLMV